MKIIDARILDAFHKMKTELHTNRAIAERMPFTAKHVGKILAGEVNYFEPKTWPDVERAIKPYLSFSKETTCNLTNQSACPFPPHTDDDDYLVMMVKRARGLPPPAMTERYSGDVESGRVITSLAGILRD
jgi:hypothetical protein